MTRAEEFNGDLSRFLNDYEYQPELTRRLDDLKEATVITQSLINEIVLWKLDRYVSLDGGQLSQIATVAALKPREHRKALPVLEELLEVHGVDLPMASTLLRFRNPAVFQIIDRHAYRALYGRDFKLSTKTSKKIEAYFEYLDDLRRLCDMKGLPFETSDRALYIFDKKTNGRL